MKKVIALASQNWLDISIQHTGTVNNAYDIATLNNKSLTDDLTAGDEIYIPNDIEINNTVLQYYKARSIKPATGLTEILKNILNQTGIDFMSLENDFEIT